MFSLDTSIHVVVKMYENTIPTGSSTESRLRVEVAIELAGPLGQAIQALSWQANWEIDSGYLMVGFSRLSIFSYSERRLARVCIPTSAILISLPL